MRASVQNVPVVAAEPARAFAGLTAVDPRHVRDWDDMVRGHPEGTIFHSTYWCSVLSECYGFTPLYLAAMEEQRLRAALPLFEVRSWLTGRRGVSIPFTDACEPLVSEGYAAGDLVGAAREQGVQRGWKYLELRDPCGETDISPSLTFFTHFLDLNRSAESLFAGFDPGVQRAIRKAEKSGIEISIEDSKEAMEAYYRLHCITRQRHGLPPQPAGFFGKILEHIIAAGHGFIVLGRLAGEAIAGAVFFIFGRQAIFKFGASNNQFQNLRPNNLVMWGGIRQLCALGLGRLSFGRTGAAEEGLRRFKRGWGSSERTLCYYRYNLKTHSCAAAKDPAHGGHNWVFRTLPAWANRQIGKLLYRHIA